MRILIAEDDLASRKFLSRFLAAYGDCDITVDGLEAIDAFLLALEEGEPYDLVCLDIMMPKLDGLKALRRIRDLERERDIPAGKEAKIIMTTALNEKEYVFEAFESGSQGYASKPIDTDKFLEVMRKLGLIQ